MNQKEIYYKMMKVKECSDFNFINWEEFRKIEGPGYCKLIPK